MKFIFVKTKELKEFEVEILRTIKYFKHNAIKCILGSLLMYLSLVFLIIAL